MGLEPAEPLARVMWIGEQESPAAGEVIQPLRAQRLIRRNIGQVIRVR
jgi:hypothetical protein